MTSLSALQRPLNREIGDANQTLCAASVVSCITSLLFSNDKKCIRNMGQLMVLRILLATLGIPSLHAQSATRVGPPGIVSFLSPHISGSRNPYTRKVSDHLYQHSSWPRSMPSPPASLEREDENLPRISRIPLV